MSYLRRFGGGSNLSSHPGHHPGKEHEARQNDVCIALDGKEREEFVLQDPIDAAPLVLEVHIHGLEALSIFRLRSFRDAIHILLLCTAETETTSVVFALRQIVIDDHCSWEVANDEDVVEDDERRTVDPKGADGG